MNDKCLPVSCELPSAVFLFWIHPSCSWSKGDPQALMETIYKKEID